MSTTLFFILALLAVSPWGSPPLALLTGLLLALTVGNPYPKKSKTYSKWLLQAAVVGLGFGLNLYTIITVGSQGLLLTFVTISATLLLGMGLAKLFKVDRKAGMLIAVGTAICGGSAIAAVGPVISASDEEMSVSLGTIFILNSIALFLFPLIGHAFAMSEGSFGVWAALAIHDTSSVVGATASYGKHALEIGTTIKLTRALWIIPVAFAFSLLERRREAKLTNEDVKKRPKLQIPWFIAFFILASVIRTVFAATSEAHGAMIVFNAILYVAKAMLSLTLFLIGAGLSRAVLAKVGVRPLIAGVLLWIVVGVISLVSILNFS